MDVDRLAGAERRQVEGAVARVADGSRGPDFDDVTGGPPRSKPNTPVRNKAVTFNEPENDDGKCQLAVEGLSLPLTCADFYTDREPDQAFLKAKAKAVQALLNPDQHAEQIGTPLQKRKIPPADSEDDSNIRRFVDGLTFSMGAHHLRPRVRLRPPKKKQDDGKALTGLRPGWVKKRVNESRDPSDDEDRPKKTGKSNKGDGKLASVSPSGARSQYLSLGVSNFRSRKSPIATAPLPTKREPL